ncbi:hypothetical protein BDV32DRAFT_127650 [Aspergillus pseudonomiae]|uniref:Uncharacterized protein n=1 Tax=Aspergillus pseudonomiae TaxID=1506151 RepID=A0A5N7CZU9_9EURO|nr:uncharacterized protein BDV37DRAFT_259705 [Aspergillus pseudonomiae]KAB8257345.1 hypothetical protein BDV32DRAFT_127650 [Aspergillus pseudonomiae]KAE8399686.1 hypothetical protein BDV37DRAFT_259705 [Aspergillus pseudonomiae]
MDVRSIKMFLENHLTVELPKVYISASQFSLVVGLRVILFPQALSPLRRDQRYHAWKLLFIIYFSVSFLFFFSSCI